MPWSTALRTMCVSGSRMASMIVLSSSVSWPSMSSRTCLPQATARSRTTRGNLLQTLPIGCIRVFMTPACSSVVSRLSRCTVPRNAGVLLGGAELHDLVAGEDQLADQGHQLVEQADVDADAAVGDGRGAGLGRLRGEGSDGAAGGAIGGGGPGLARPSRPR